MMHRNRGFAATLLILLGLLAACSPERPAESIPAAGPAAGSVRNQSVIQVQRVIDGDSVLARYPDGQTAEVRIAGIDAPELNQPGGRRARSFLRRLLGERVVQLDAYKRDRYQRVVGNLKIDGRDLGLLMVQRGHAWHFKRFAQEQSAAVQRAYAQAEARARQNGLGLWSDPRAQPPWQWRRSQ